MRAGMSLVLREKTKRAEMSWRRAAAARHVSNSLLQFGATRRVRVPVYAVAASIEFASLPWIPTIRLELVPPPQVGDAAVPVSFADFTPVSSAVPVVWPEVALQ